MFAVVPMRRAVLVLAAFAVATVSCVLVCPQAARADAPEPTKVLLLLDVSGSMNERISSGGTKFSAAKTALKQVADSLPPGTQVGLRVYGSRIAEPKSVNKAACTDSQLVMPIAALDRTKMYRAVDSFRAKGETPIAYSLTQSVKDLGTSGKRVLVLISDGQETCANDPCPTAQKLAKAGVELQFNAVGLDVDAKARKQLQCIADAGDGSYYDASRASELSEAVRKLTQRALRPFSVSGTPVRGNNDESLAPRLTPGQYTDAYDTTNTPRYYRIDRAPGSSVTASIASTARPGGGEDYVTFDLKLSTVSGQLCDSGSFSAQTFRSASVVSGAVRAPNPLRPVAARVAGGCATEPLVLSLAHGAFVKTTKSVPVEIRIATEGTIVNLSSLPAGLKSYTAKGTAVGPTKPVRATLGGTSFANAATLTPGSWSESLAMGETLFYRVPLQTGQRLRLTMTTPRPGSSSGLGSMDILTARVMTYSPSFLQLSQQDTVVQGSDTKTMTAVSPQVRVRNREIGWQPTSVPGANQLSAAAVAGDYYVEVQLDPGANSQRGQVLPIQLDVAVDGQSSGQPVYAALATPTSTPTSPSTDPASPPSVGPNQPTAGATPNDGHRLGDVGVVLGGVALLIALAVGAGLLLRRRSRP